LFYKYYPVYNRGILHITYISDIKQIAMDKAEAFNIILEFYRNTTIRTILSSAILLGFLFFLWGYISIKTRR